MRVSSGAIIVSIIMAFCLGYLIGGNHGIRVSENLRSRK